MLNDSRRTFIKKSTGATLALLMPGMSSVYSKAKVAPVTDHGLAVQDGGSMITGVAERDVTPEIGMERPGNYMKVIHKTLHDPCKVRAVVFDDGKKRTAIVGIDALMIPRDIVVSVRKKVEARCGIPAEAILIGASHSHSSGPIGFVQPGEYDHADAFVRSLAYDESPAADAKYLQHVENMLVEVICAADASRAECRVGIGVGHEDKAGVNRRYHMKNGMTYTYPGRGNPDVLEPAGPIDPEVGVIGVWDKQGKCIGCVVNFARHANTPASGISANWIYYMEQTIRGAMGQDCIVVYLAGANGNISHDNQHDPYASLSGEDKSRYVGGRVGAEAIKVLMSMPRGTLTPVDYKSTVMRMKRRVPDPARVKKAYELVKKSKEEVGMTDWLFAKEIVLLDALLEKHPEAEVEVQAVQVGPVVFVTNPAEFFVEFGLEIKERSKFKYTFPVELANGCVGYVPTEEAFGPKGGGYETRLTSYSNLEIKAGSRMVDAGVKLANQMTPGAEPEFPKPKPFGGEPWSYGNVKPELK